jgi:peroxiredoxin
MLRIIPLALTLGLAACTKSEAPPHEAALAETTEVEAAGAPDTPTLEGPLPLGAEMPAADVEMKGVDGEMYTLSEIAGENGTLVIFTCNHCPYAKAWEERVAEIGNAYREKGIGVVAVNPNDPAKYEVDGYEGMQARSEKLGLEFPYVVDATSDVARAYGATKTPEAYLFDAEGALVYHGAIDDNAEAPEAVEDAYLKAALEALLAGEPVPMPETRAVGCSIKFRAKS